MPRKLAPNHTLPTYGGVDIKFALQTMSFKSLENPEDDSYTFKVLHDIGALRLNARDGKTLTEDAEKLRNAYNSLPQNRGDGILFSTLLPIFAALDHLPVIRVWQLFLSLKPASNASAGFSQNNLSYLVVHLYVFMRWRELFENGGLTESQKEIFKRFHLNTQSLDELLDILNLLQYRPRIMSCNITLGSRRGVRLEGYVGYLLHLESTPPILAMDVIDEEEDIPQLIEKLRQSPAEKTTAGALIAHYYLACDDNSAQQFHIIQQLIPVLHEIIAGLIDATIKLVENLTANQQTLDDLSNSTQNIGFLIEQLFDTNPEQQWLAAKFPDYEKHSSMWKQTLLTLDEKISQYKKSPDRSAVSTLRRFLSDAAYWSYGKGLPAGVEKMHEHIQKPHYSIEGLLQNLQTTARGHEHKGLAALFKNPKAKAFYQAVRNATSMVNVH